MKQSEKKSILIMKKAEKAAIVFVPIPTSGIEGE
jgi:hypothetical protein